MSHEPDERSVKLLVRKGRKKRKGKAPRKPGTRCRSTIMRWDETEKRVCSAWMRGPSAKTRRKARSEEHTSELQSLMRISYAVFCLKKKEQKRTSNHQEITNERAYGSK